MKKTFLIAFAILMSSQVFASGRTFSMVDNSTGEQFLCTSGSSSGPADIDCTSKVSQTCRSTTSEGGNQCFQDATSACKGSGPRFSQCVDATSQECRSTTSLGGNACFQQALSTCRN